MIKLLVMLVFVASAADGEVFTWTDGRGVAHYTNKDYEVPPRYRARAKVMYQEQPAAPSQQNSQNQAAVTEVQATVQDKAGPSAQLPATAPVPPAVTVKSVGQQQSQEGRRGTGTKTRRVRGVTSEPAD